MSGKSPVIVLDGPAGAGKSSAAREAAGRLDLPFLDTGAIYRAIALLARRAGISPDDAAGVKALADGFDISFAGGRVRARGEDVTEAIRTPEIDGCVSAYAALPEVRAALLGIQRAQASGGLVAEGRDMGTVVFPGADLKIFLTASPEARARRRCLEREAKGEPADFEATLAAIRERDALDEGRETAPLRAADDAVALDTTGMTLEEVVTRVIELAAARGIAR